MKHGKLMRCISLKIFVACFAFEITGYSAEPVEVQPHEVVFRLVTLDRTIKIPAENNPVDKPPVLGGWGFTGASFSDGAFVLRMTNVSNALETFSFIDTWSVIVVGSDGHTLPQEGGRDKTLLAERCDFKDARPSETVNFVISYKLSHDKEGKLVLWGDDGIGGIWACGPITTGKYKIHVEYSFDSTSGNMLWNDFAKEKLGMKTSSLWVGNGKTNKVELEIQ